jgi:RNA polymerase sigma-70 factor (ECF subfamily)
MVKFHSRALRRCTEPCRPAGDHVLGCRVFAPADDRGWHRTTEVVLVAARSGNEQAFDQLVTGHRRELLAYCYRMLGSLPDAEDALQETLLAAWRGLSGFEGRSSVRTWLYRIATHVCLRQAGKAPPKMLSWDHGPSLSAGDETGAPVLEPIWLDPWPSDPADDLVRRESIGLAFVAALQHLPASQRAVLILRDVLAFNAEETAALLQTSTASVNSALQRARRSMTTRVATEPTVAEEHQGLLNAFVRAWEASDVDALVRLLSRDVVFTMPPLPAWFGGRADVIGFIRRRAFTGPWRLVPLVANAQPGFGCYQWNGSAHVLGAVNVLSISGDRITWIAGFVDPGVTSRFGLPNELLLDR